MFLIFLALLPAIALVIWIYKQDKVEKEPKELLVKIFIFGVISVIPTIFVEALLGEICDRFLDTDSMIYTVVYYVIGIALVEETFKMLAAKLASWKDKAFNYKFDAIVYCVISALGFAAIENIFYVLQNGLTTAIMRAVMSVPAHATFGLIMGYFFGIAKEAEVYGNKKIYRQYMMFSVLIPTVAHGIYDIACFQKNGYIMLLLIGFIIMVDIWAIRFVKKQSKEDYELL